MVPPEVDVVIAFRATKKTSLSKQKIREEASKAKQQYASLIHKLTTAGLRAVGRRGEALGHLFVFVSCPKGLLSSLVQRERHTDFLSGLPTTPLTPGASDILLSSADRLRLVHMFITCVDGGLGITPGSPNWDLVESVFALHDKQFNESWVRRWSPRQIISVDLEKIRGQFGESVALYYAFLAFYTQGLIFPAVLGLLNYLFSAPYSPVYSILVFIWSVVFVEGWNVHERILSLHFGTRGSFLVEKRRADYKPGITWWQRELRMVASLPIILLCAGLLAALLTGNFVLEAFVTEIYNGPGHRYVSLAPTILFSALIPQFLGLYQALARKLTAWENHSHQSTYTTSLTLKTSALSALVAYLGLGLSAFVYVPFGEGIMRMTQTWISTASQSKLRSITTTTTTTTTTVTARARETLASASFWDIDISSAQSHLNPALLRQQMFAFTVTNQVMNTINAVVVPFIVRAVMHFRDRRKPHGTPNTSGGKNVKKRVVFEDEKEKGGLEEREFLDSVRAQVELPEYDLFEDYDEMVTQFGYVACWSTIWPLAPVMALVNNFFELRSDPFKMTIHKRRPIPVRTDSIGPWLETLTVLSWLSALTNASLVYLFCPRAEIKCSATYGIDTLLLEKVRQHLFSSEGLGAAGGMATKQLLMTILLILLFASHGYILVRLAVRHIVERMFWTTSEEVKDREKQDREVRAKFLEEFTRSLDDDAVASELDSTNTFEEASGSQKRNGASEAPGDGGVFGFWDHDEGLEEISRVSKEV